jgi:hypothetical protein
VVLYDSICTFTINYYSNPFLTKDNNDELRKARFTFVNHRTSEEYSSKIINFSKLLVFYELHNPLPILVKYCTSVELDGEGIPKIPIDFVVQRG